MRPGEHATRALWINYASQTMCGAPVIPASARPTMIGSGRRQRGAAVTRGVAMFEFEDPRVLRWFALLISLVIEAAAFWYGGVNVDPNASFATNLLLKAQSAGAWTWLGWVSFTLTWLWLELVRLPFINS